MARPNKSSVEKHLDKLMKKTPMNTGGTPCTCCQSPYKEAIWYVLDTVIPTQQVISSSQIHQMIKEIYPELPVQPATLLRHLSQHEGERWDRANVYRRGPKVV